MKRDPKTILTLAFALVALLAFPAGAQSKKESKAAEKFRSQSEQARKSVENIRGQLDLTLKAYEALLTAKEKKLASAHKKLAGEIDKTEKAVESARKSAQGLQEGAEGFFTMWEANLESISTESIRDASGQRLEAAREKFQSMLDNLGAAKEAYDPLISSLKEQATLLHQDLTPDTVAMMSDGAAADVRANGEQVLASLDRVLNNEKMHEEEVAEILDEEVESPSDAIEEGAGDSETTEDEGTEGGE